MIRPRVARACSATRLFEIICAGEPDDFTPVVHPEATNREAAVEPPAARGRGPAAWYATARWLRNLSTDLRFDIHDIVSEGDLVALHVTMSGHQTGDHAHYDAAGAVVMTMPATGRPFATTQSHWFRVADGRLIEHWANRDDLGIATQLRWFERG